MMEDGMMEDGTDPFVLLFEADDRRWGACDDHD